MKSEIAVRPARAEDQGAVLAFCQHTFSWGDYIPEVWDAWLADVNGQMFVALLANQPVGVVHVALVNGVAWMEGMRVHPDFRRHGIGGTLEIAAHAFAHEKGCRTARLATSVKNTAAQGLLAKLGYRRAAQFVEWETEPARGDFAVARVATEADLPDLLARWNQSEIHAVCAVVPDRRWHWIELTPARVREQIARGEARATAHGFALLLAFDESDWNGLSLHALVGDEETAFALALAARGEAEYRGYRRVEAILVDHAALNAALERAGYRRKGGMFVYEQEV